MIVIAESGSTKTEWIVLNDRQKVVELYTTGFNPNYFPPGVLSKAVSELATKMDTDLAEKIYYYGSGCLSDTSKKIVIDVLRPQFTKANIIVENDLFGAGLALFGRQEGIACILGTGSNSCLFVGGKIIANVRSLGYLFGDEGSGFQIGKKLLYAFFRNDLPQNLKIAFNNDYNLDISTFVTEIYADTKPNSRIASFFPFAVRHRHEPSIKKIIREAFTDFFTENILRYPGYRNYPLRFTGTVAYLLEEELREIADVFDLTIDKIIKNPVEELVSYHLNYG